MMKEIWCSSDIYYYSSAAGRTAALVEKLPFHSTRIPGSYRKQVDPPYVVADTTYVLFVPTYKSEIQQNYVPRCIKEFLLTNNNYKYMRGVVGIGNINFGKDYNKAADLIHQRFGTPILGKVELSGTQEDAEDLEKIINSVLKINKSSIFGRDLF